jgi:plasmid maintenance system antidote protein VapI
MQMWIELQEDVKIQELEQKEGNINTRVRDLKHRKKNMAILERIKSV